MVKRQLNYLRPRSRPLRTPFQVARSELLGDFVKQGLSIGQSEKGMTEQMKEKMKMRIGFHIMYVANERPKILFGKYREYLANGVIKRLFTRSERSKILHIIGKREHHPFPGWATMEEMEAFLFKGKAHPERQLEFDFK